jgi:hypothetical protein
MMFDFLYITRHFLKFRKLEHLNFEIVSDFGFRNSDFLFIDPFPSLLH